jgi:hypothetical protein
MDLYFKNKKIALSFNDFCNPYFNNYIKELSVNNKLILYTSQISAKNFFGNKIKIKILNKKSFFYNLLMIFSKSRNSSLQTYHYIEKIINQKFLFKFFYIIKYILYKFHLLIDINFLRDNFIKPICNKEESYDYVITDFRLNEIYSNHEVLNYAKINKIKIIAILFSWDNLFSADVNISADYYFVGSTQLKKILHNRFNIPYSKIYKYNPFQFEYLYQKKKFKTNKAINYILYSCSVEESSKIIDEEFEIINHVAKFLINNQFNIKIYVRPYPFFIKKINFKKKIKYSNIKIIEYGKNIIRMNFNNQNRYMRFEKNYKNKFRLLKNAILHLNILSTIGIESSLINKPSLFINIKKNINFLELPNYFRSNFFKTKYIDHFKIFSKQKLFITSYKELDAILKQFFLNNRNNIKKNTFIKNFFLN